MRTRNGVEEICLAWKEPTPNALKRGLADKWNAYGGAYELTDVSIEAAATRELRQESGVVVLPEDLVKIGEVLYVNSWGNFLCHDFVARKFSDEPRSTREMSRPTWFPVADIPYAEMMASDSYTLPAIITGRKIKATIVHDEHMNVVKGETTYVVRF